MPNLLLTPELWYDNTVPPPQSWNGTSYVKSYAAEILNNFFLVLDDPAPSDATFSGTALLTSTDNAITQITLSVEDVGAKVTFDSVTIPVGVATAFSMDAPAGSNVTLLSDQVYGLSTTITPASAPPAVECDEVGRTTRVYASGFVRDRVHEARLMAPERRCLVVDFNGAIAKARTIQSVEWRMENAMPAVMSDARILGRQVDVQLRAQRRGASLVRCVVTLDNGERLLQWIRVVVGELWAFAEATAPGPNLLTATASP